MGATAKLSSSAKYRPASTVWVTQMSQMILMPQARANLRAPAATGSAAQDQDAACEVLGCKGLKGGNESAATCSFLTFKDRHCAAAVPEQTLQ